MVSPLSSRARRRAERRDEALGRLRAVALVDPRLEQIERNALAGGERRRHPAALAEPVAGRARERELQRGRPGVRQLARDRERIALDAQVRECLVVDGEVEMA